MSCEETFGPVAGIARFTREADAVRVANDTPYGLSAYIYTRDLGRTWRVSEALDYGIVGINTGFIRPRWRRSEASRNRASGVKARATASTTTGLS